MIMTIDNTTKLTKPILSLNFKKQTEEKSLMGPQKDHYSLGQDQEHNSALSLNSTLPNNSNEQSDADSSKKDRPKFSKHGKKLLNDREYRSILEYMQNHYPKCFPAVAPLVPLAIGIHRQIFNIENLPFSRLKIRGFFKKYTQIKNYRKRLVIGNDRFGLDGTPTSQVLKEEIDLLKWKSINGISKNLESPLPSNDRSENFHDNTN